MMTEHVKEVCQIGQGSLCCRFLMMGAQGFECGRKNGLEAAIDAKMNTMTAKGNNCDGKSIKELNDGESK